MEENKKFSKEELIKIKNHISKQIDIIEDFCNKEAEKIKAIAGTIPLYQQQLALAEAKLKEVEQEPKKS